MGRDLLILKSSIIFMSSQLWRISWTSVRNGRRIRTSTARRTKKEAKALKEYMSKLNKSNIKIKQIR